jgi:transposase
MKLTNGFPDITMGLDLGDRVSVFCSLSWAGEVTERGDVKTHPHDLEMLFSRMEPSRVVLECGTHSAWVSRLAQRCGHEVIVANTRELYPKKRRKNDAIDAERLARKGRSDPQELAPIKHRSVEAQEELTLVRARHALVSSRSGLINHVRGSVKAMGSRVASCDAESFTSKAKECIPQGLQANLKPVLRSIDELTKQIRQYDKRVQTACKKHPETERLQQVTGVGPVTALTFSLVIDDPKRFTKSRTVGAYLGLTPRLWESGDCEPQLRISKTGDKLLRSLLVSCAHYILGRRGPDCDLRRHGEKMCARGGKNAKKRAVVAMARKLAVLLHSLWVSGATYDPLKNSRRKATKPSGRMKVKSCPEAKEEAQA